MPAPAPCSASRHRATRGRGRMAPLLLCALAACASPPPGARPPDAAWHAPFAVPRDHLLHATLEVPPLQSAEPLPEGARLAQWRSDHAHAEARGHADGWPQSFDGLMHEWLVLQWRWGAAEDLELGARFSYTGWDEHDDSFALLDGAGDALVSDEQPVIDGTGASQRHKGLHEVVLEAKRALARRGPWTFAGQASAKLPLGRARDLANADTFDLALAALATRRPGAPGRATWHLQAGAGWPLGDTDLFVDGAPADVRPFAFAAVAATWALDADTLLGLQVEANTSAFEHLPLHDGAPLSVVGGLRQLSGAWLLEAGVGAGLNEAAADLSLHLAAARPF